MNGVRQTVAARLGSAALLVLSLGGVSCQAMAAGSTTPTTTTRPAKPASGSVSDAQLEATIRAKLAKSKVGKDGFKFHVQHGVVTWEGETNVPQHKGAATRMARTAGALGVVNNIQVGDEAKAKSLSQLHHATVKPQ
jgi:osmotically-inducible protein OsmY